MASTTIAPTGVAATYDCGVIGSGGVGTLSDGNAGTGYRNGHGNFVGYVRVYSTASPPANFPGATISSVQVSWFADANQTRGSAHIRLRLGGNSTTSAVIGPGMFGGTTAALARPGGGSWTSADFFNSGLTWEWIWDGNADDVTRTILCAELKMIVNYTPISAPVAAFTVSTTTGTAPLSVTFTDQGTNSPTSWLWTLGDGNTSTTQHPVHVYTTAGTYTVTLTETNAGGSSNISTASLINALTSAAAVVAEFSAVPRSGVQNLSVNFYDGSTGTPAPTSWLWAFGDSATSTEQNPVHVYTTAGTYTVTLTATSTIATATMTTDSEQKTSYITVSNGLPVPLAQYETGGGTTVTTVASTGFRPLSLQFRGSATNALPTGWLWEFGDGIESIVEDPSHIYTTVGTFTPTLTVTNALGTASTTCGPITVNFETITAGFTCAPLMGYAPLTVRFTDETQGDVNSWAWNFGDSATSSEQHPTHTYVTAYASVNLTVSETGYSDAYNLRHDLSNYWKLEETTGVATRADFISTAHLTPSDSLTQTTGINGYAQAVSSFKRLGRTTGFTNTSNFSISGWVYFTGGVGTVNIFDFPPSTSAWGLITYTGGPAAVLALTPPTMVGSTAITADTWHHVVFTYNATTRKAQAYLDGVLEVEGVMSTAPSTTGFWINRDELVDPFTIDEVGRYNSILDQDQINGLYNAGEGLFFTLQQATDSESVAQICPIAPDHTFGYFFEEMKYQLMEPMWDQDVCEGFDDFGGMQKALDFTWQRLNRFVLETACLRKETTLGAATTDTEDFALPADMIEILRLEVGGTPYYSADQYQRDRETPNNVYIVDGLTVTIPGVFGTSPTVKVLHSYLPTKPTIPAPCTCPTPPATGPWGFFPIPYTLWWIIRYGVMADLFSQAGLRNDPQRAAKCESLFQDGLNIYKALYRGF